MAGRGRVLTSFLKGGGGTAMQKGKKEPKVLTPSASGKTCQEENKKEKEKGSKS